MSLSLTLKKYKKDIIFLLVLTLVILPAFVATVVFSAAGSFSPGSLSFGNVVVGNDKSMSVSFTNTSPDPISYSVSAGSGFSCVGGCSFNNVSPADSRLTTLRFSPGSTGAYSANGNFSSGAGDSVACSATETTPPASCTLDGVTRTHGNSATFYSNSSPTFPTVCTDVDLVRTCNDGTYSGSNSYNRASCTDTGPASCTLDGINRAHGGSYNFYSTNSTSYPTTCSAVDLVRTCNNGNWSGSNSYNRASCTSGTPASCTLDGVTRTHGNSATFYSDSSPTSPTQCTDVDLVRTCNNGTYSGSSAYNKASCTATGGPSPSCCLRNDGNKDPTCSALSSDYSACESHGGCMWNTTSPSCSAPIPSNCSLDGVNVNHGSSATFYSSSNPTHPTQCTDVDLVRTCTDGVLSGSNAYNKASCTNPAAPTCTFYRPFGWWDGPNHCVEYYKAPGGTADEMILNEGQSYTGSAGYCPFGGPCNGSFTVTCSSAPSLVFTNEVCKPGHKH